MTVTHLETAPQKALSPSKRKGYTPKHFKRNIPAANHTAVVSAKQFVPAINRVIAQMDAELNLLGEPGTFGVIGPVGIICENAARLSGHKLDGLFRRLYGIRHEESRLMRAETAEALAMGAGTDLRELGVMELPAGMEAAKERLSIWFELHANGRPWPSRKVFRELAEDLLEFSKLMIHGPAEEYPSEFRTPELNREICYGLEALFALAQPDAELQEVA